jgi:hypothetical protein
MKRTAVVLALTIIAAAGYSQSQAVQAINKVVNRSTALEPLKYLASDELKGRSAKRPEIHVAAKYISDQLKKAGAKPLPQAADYYQTFELKLLTLASTGSLVVGDHTFNIGKDLLQVDGPDISINAPIVYAGFGTGDELNRADVEGKIVVTRFGINDSSTVRAGFSNQDSKQQLLKQKGAVALIEMFWQNDVPWTAIQTAYAHERMVLHVDSFPAFLINVADTSLINSLPHSQHASLSSAGNAVKTIPAKNVMAYIEGTDSKLKDQYIALSAHYDHLGVGATAQTLDSIFNGARDNAIGVAAVLNAAKYFGRYPPKRSVLFILFTGEELGLLGSRYFGEHPVLPFRQIVYNLNCDNGGYNDTSIVTVIGLGRTSADDDIIKASAAYGLKAIADPVPELNLFDRSDNLNLAVKGIPAPTFGMGVTGFDDEIRKYYHQVTDEVGSFDLGYGLKYVRSYILAAQNIANNPKQPTWAPGDKYEPTWKKLFASDSF